MTLKQLLENQRSLIDDAKKAVASVHWFDLLNRIGLCPTSSARGALWADCPFCALERKDSKATFYHGTQRFYCMCCGRNGDMFAFLYLLFEQDSNGNPELAAAERIRMHAPACFKKHAAPAA